MTYPISLRDHLRPLAAINGNFDDCHFSSNPFHAGQCRPVGGGHLQTDIIRTMSHRGTRSHSDREESRPKFGSRRRTDGGLRAAMSPCQHHSCPFSLNLGHDTASDLRCPRLDENGSVRLSH